MDRTIRIVGVIPETDIELQAHEAVVVACKNAKTSLPEETAKYLRVKEASEYQSEGNLEFRLVEKEYYSVIEVEGVKGFEIHLLAIPKGVVKLRYFI